MKKARTFAHAAAALCCAAGRDTTVRGEEPADPPPPPPLAHSILITAPFLNQIEEIGLEIVVGGTTTGPVNGFFGVTTSIVGQARSNKSVAYDHLNPGSWNGTSKKLEGPVGFRKLKAALFDGAEEEVATSVQNFEALQR